MNDPSVIVIGAGVVGASAALALVERGLDVTLVDRAPEAAAGTSHANGGGITPCHAEPWNPPGTARRLFSTLLDRRLPYRLHPRALPGLIGWGSRFLVNSRAGRYYENARRTTRLAIYSGRCLARLRERHRLDYLQVVEGSLELYFSRADFDRAIELRRRIADPDIRLQKLTAEEAVALEPTLGPVAGQIHAALLFPDHESGDARLFSRRVSERAGQLGARLAFGTHVERIVCRGGKFDRLSTDRGEFVADACVVAAGYQTVALLSPLGLKVPIYPVKGYSATIDVTDDDPAPRLPLLDLKRRFVTARLGRQLRIAGLADFAGPDLELYPDRLGVLLEGAAQLLPELAEKIRTSPNRAWTGLRPMTPDGPPLIGPTPIAGLYLNSGYGAMGWTQACGSAELLADLITNRPPAIDTTGLLAERYLRS